MEEILLIILIIVLINSPRKERHPDKDYEVKIYEKKKKKDK